MPLGQKVASLYAEIGVNTKPAETGIANFKRNLNQLDREFIKSGQTLGSLRGQVGAYAQTLKAATPENLRFAQRFQTIQKAVDRGKISIGDAQGAVSKLQDEMRASLPATTRLKEGLMGMASTAALVTGGVVAFGVAAKKAFDLGKEGANLLLTEQRFYRLAESIGTTGDALIKDLGPAMGGMLSQSEQMAAATDLMALGLVKSHDEAIRLARVSGQLGMNMNQLVLTLTNQTTMRFDALGVSVDGFDEKVKALEATGMSASDAFQEAFLQQAEEQLERVGSAADTTAGKFARLEARTKDLGDAFKRSLAVGLEPTVDALATMLEAQNALTSAVEDGIITEKERTRISREISAMHMTNAEAVQYLNWLENEHNDRLKQVSMATRDLTVDMSSYDDVLQNFNTEQNKTNAQLSQAANIAGIASQQYNDYAFSAYEAATATKTVQDATWGVNEAMETYSKQLLFAKASEYLTADGALYLAGRLGLVDENTVKLMETLPKIRDEFDLNKDGLIDNQEAALGAAQAILEFDAAASRIDGKTYRSTVITEFFENRYGNVGARDAGLVEGTDTSDRQSGGPVFANQPYIVGERGPELFVPRQNGEVVSNDKMNNYGGITVNIYGDATRNNAALLARQIGAELNRQSRYH